MFGFNPVTYSTNEDAGSQALTAILEDGNLGDFSYTLTAATDESNALATATGMSRVS